MSIAIENLKDKTGLHEGVEVTYTVVEEVIHETDVLKTGSNNHLISNDDTQWNSDVVAFVKKLTGNASSLKKYIEDEDLLEDTLVETQQAIEMAGIYENVLNAMAETSASIIGNNQNTIMKTLALMTMALDIPTVIFSAYGMNFKNNSMPLNDLDNAFWVIFFIAAFGSSCVVIYFIRKKWF